MKNTMIIDVEQNPKRLRDWFLFSFQHVLAMLVACITVPLLTGLPLGATICAAGIGTLIYIFITKKKSPVFLSSSFAYLSPMFSALSVGAIKNQLEPITPNYLAVVIGMLLVGFIYVVIALIIKKVGTKWLNKLLPPVVIGPVIMIIGLSLSTSAVNNVMSGTNMIGAVGAANNGVVPWEYTIVSVVVALVACISTAVAAHYGKKTASLIPFVIGMGVAYLFAIILTLFSLIDGAECLRVIDFTIFDKDWTSVDAWITTDWMIGRIVSQNRVFGAAEFGSVCLLFIPVSLVTVAEHIGDHKNLGNIIGRDLLSKEPGLTRTLIGDGIATAVSGAMCGAANTTYGENVAVIGVSKIASTNVVLVASVMAVVLGLFAPLTTVLETIPACITGGVSLILYGFIASSGVKMLINEKVDFSKTKNIMVASVILVVGIGGLILGFGGDSNGYTVQITSTAVAMILGIFLNLILKDKKAQSEEPAVLAGADDQDAPQDATQDAQPSDVSNASDVANDVTSNNAETTPVDVVDSLVDTPQE